LRDNLYSAVQHPPRVVQAAAVGVEMIHYGMSKTALLG
jgi:hypothetical protein